MRQKRPSSIRQKPLEIFIIAEQFYWAGKLASRVPHEVEAGNPKYAFGRGLPNMTAAATACLAFSLELYLKCLIRIGKKPPETGHDLVKLFGKIGMKHQAAIRRYFLRNIEDVRTHLEREYAASGRLPPKVDFDFVLSASKDAFTQMRYLHEGLPPDKGWLADDILEGVRHSILEKYPEWARAHQDSLIGEVVVRPTSQVR